MDEQRRKKIKKGGKKKKLLGTSPEDDPLWGLFGVWGRVLIVFSNIGFLLFLGSTILGWGMLKFLLHVFGIGLLLLFSRPNYSPFMSGIYCDSGMTNEEIDELRRMVIRKLHGQSFTTSPSPSGSATSQSDLLGAVARDAPAQSVAAATVRQEQHRHSRLGGSLGMVGRFFRRVVDQH